MSRQGLITYEGLPIASGGAHALSGRGFAAGWAEVDRFLKKCTDFKRPDEILLELLEGPGLPAEWTEPLSQAFAERYSAARSRRVGRAVGHQWPIADDGLLALLQYLDGVGPLPRSSVPPVAVYATARFRFVGRSSGKPLVFQDPALYLNQDAGFAGHRLRLGSSMACARISGRSTLSVFFSLPFAEPSKEFVRYAGFLAAHAPFTISPKHWKLWSLNKSGDRYTARKIGGVLIPAGTARLTH